MMNRSPLYSVVVPVYRSAKTLPELYERVNQTFAGMEGNYELILVEDGGGDESWQVMQSLRQRDPRVKIIRLMRNFGQHNALLAGFSFASGAYIITIDDDLQNPPEEIPKLIEAMQKQNQDVVFGIPREKKHSNWRNWCSQLFHRAVSSSFDRLRTPKISMF
ncbi:MAG: Undecaprenyl-phosphate 4-deoxy-4-formamido-L-arabinose transferase [Planctomycetes bacterium ADurb.Bin412]|nr:MAG: Undecaprenyl-phosphate 4-deoxy-4-formamido-L-arabinose transferase [Planctomycetes bacterium ADurb.Bin412]